jgi:D-alanyl-D-alanine carboxypeptidase (penicillin-binding protein 5/6)
MLSEFEGSTGIKTGFTKKAGRCLVSSCERDGMELICVVLNCPPMFERSKSLLTNAFNEFKLVKLFESDYIIDFLPADEKTEKCGIYIRNDIVLPLSIEEKNKLKIVYDYPEKLENQLEKDEEIGSIKIYCENNLLFEEKIYTIIKVD